MGFQGEVQKSMSVCFIYIWVFFSSWRKSYVFTQCADTVVSVHDYWMFTPHSTIRNSTTVSSVSSTVLHHKSKGVDGVSWRRKKNTAKEMEGWTEGGREMRERKLTLQKWQQKWMLNKALQQTVCNVLAGAALFILTFPTLRNKNLFFFLKESAQQRRTHKHTTNEKRYNRWAIFTLSWPTDSCAFIYTRFLHTIVKSQRRHGVWSYECRKTVELQVFQWNCVRVASTQTHPHTDTRTDIHIFLPSTSFQAKGMKP